MANYNYAHENDAVKPYLGRMSEQMPLLKADGRILVSVAWVMERRLITLSRGLPTSHFDFILSGQKITEENEVTDTYWNRYIDTTDAEVNHPDGRAKIVLDSTHLKELTSKNEFVNHGLVLKDADIYEAATGSYVIELTKADLEKYTGKDLSKKEALSNKIWRILARHPEEVPPEIARDKNLLKEYIAAAFPLVRKMYVLPNYNIMKLEHNIPVTESILRRWRMGNFCEATYTNNVLNTGDGNFIAVLPDSLESTVSRNITRR